MNYSDKKKLFSEISKNQKSALLAYLKICVRKKPNLTSQEILDLFIEEENYYKSVGNIHFEWIFEYFEDDIFIKDIKKYIEYLLVQIEQKERQNPYLEEQKQKAKLIKKQIQEYKMAKASPTKKQLYYYEKLCKKYNIEMKKVDELSRLDLRNLIDEILKVANEDFCKKQDIII